MTIYVFRDGDYVNKATGEPMNDPTVPFVVSAPMIMKGMETYQSPIDGKAINSRQERKDDLKANNCVEYEPSLSPVKDGFKNKRFAKKHGLELGEAYK